MTKQKNVLAVREAIEAAHPEVTITTPLSSRSRKWELTTDGDSTTYDDFWMIDHLAARFGEIEPEADDGPLRTVTRR